REIVNGLEINNSKLYHLGLSPVKRSTLADANKIRSYQIYASLFYKILSKCKE
ncbi:transposase IS4 family protein, partial [Candidatus Omnitrophus magneticus]